MNDFAWSKLKLPVYGKEVNIKNWNYLEDVELNKKISQTENSEDKIKIILEFLKDHVKEKKVFDELTDVDIYKILFVLRNNSKGNEIKYMWKCFNEDFNGKQCPAHNQYQHTALDIIKEVQYKVSKVEDKKLDDRYTIKFKNISFLNKLKIINNISTTEELKYQLVLGSIESIIRDDELINFSSNKELDKFLKNIEPKYVYKIIESYKDNVSSVDILKKNVCSKCGSINDLVIGDFSFFL